MRSVCTGRGWSTFIQVYTDHRVTTIPISQSSSESLKYNNTSQRKPYTEVATSYLLPTLHQRKALWWNVNVIFFKRLRCKYCYRKYFVKKNYIHLAIRNMQDSPNSSRKRIRERERGAASRSSQKRIATTYL